MVLYRKYRPQKLAELVGQEHIKSSLVAALTSGKVAHAYLFAGPRGSGKTTTARILAKAVNCRAYRLLSTVYRKKGSSQRAVDSMRAFGEPCNKCHSCLAVVDGSHLDLIEIDAASNRGIDDVRDLREKIKLSPVAGRFKVYIIDEAHMLTNEAFNALLKTLEEPPSHAIFVLCTTAAEKLPVTIISRCNRLDFKKATIVQLQQAISPIIKKEEIKITEDAIFRICQIADGSFRDSLTVLDQLASQNKKVEVTDVDKLCAFAGVETVAQLVEHLGQAKVAEAIILVNNLVWQGGDLKRFTDELLEYLRTMLFTASGLAETVKDNYSQDIFVRLEKQAESWPREKISQALRLFTEAANSLKSAIITQLPLELAIVDLVGQKLADEEIIPNPQEIISRPIITDHPKESELKVNGKKTKNLKQLNKKWSEFLKEVRKHNVSVESLLRLAQPVSFADNTLTLEVFYRFHKEKIESLPVYRLITAVAQEVFGLKNIKIRCILGQKPTKTTLVEDLEAAVVEIFSS